MITKSEIVLRNTESIGSTSLSGDKVVLTAPAGYAFTGEYRPPKAGEDFYTPTGAACRTNLDFLPEYSRFILRKAETARDRRARRLRDLFTGHIGIEHPVPGGVYIYMPPTKFAEAVEAIFAEERD